MNERPTKHLLSSSRSLHLKAGYLQTVCVPPRQQHTAGVPLPVLIDPLCESLHVYCRQRFVVALLQVRRLQFHSKSMPKPSHIHIWQIPERMLILYCTSVNSDLIKRRKLSSTLPRRLLSGQAVL